MRVNWGTAQEPGWQVLDVAGADPAGLASARRWAAAKLAALAETDRVDAVIVVGELLENAYVHATGPSQLRLHLTRDPCVVTVAVADTGRGEPRQRAPGRSGGRGLLLVDELALDWGVSHHDDGKVVWARLPCEDSR
ncbi:ATP-binding protein [Amycolatopsis rifamycinica]|uniref:ATPase n=1 Tax=Amycolatopsis rifamycinica TaxID=287986 RepID=A0A066TUI2_9PSEU|nr:ATP-binding protein [Amycolatopsis rifamycinica]KDN17182.1 ATPase [Amycolatopsis rifamycinica]